MAETVKKGDFIELDYTGKTKDEGLVFDTTKQSVADEAHLHVHKAFKPIVVCVGEGHVLPGVDTRLVGLAFGQHTFAVPAEEAFGKKSAKLLQLIPRKVFKEQNVQPMVGMEINVDNQVGVIKTVSGGRIIVDFNHPLASKDLIYDVEIKRKVDDQLEQVKALLEIMRLPFKEVTLTDGKVVVTGVQQLPGEFVDVFAKDIVRLTGVKDITFGGGEEPKAATPIKEKK